MAKVSGPGRPPARRYAGAELRAQTLAECDQRVRLEIELARAVSGEHELSFDLEHALRWLRAVVAADGSGTRELFAEVVRRVSGSPALRRALVAHHGDGASRVASGTHDPELAALDSLARAVAEHAAAPHAAAQRRRAGKRKRRSRLDEAARPKAPRLELLSAVDKVGLWWWEHRRPTDTELALLSILTEAVEVGGDEPRSPAEVIEQEAKRIAEARAQIVGPAPSPKKRNRQDR